MWTTPAGEVHLEPHEVKLVAKRIVAKIKILAEREGTTAQALWIATVNAFNGIKDYQNHDNTIIRPKQPSSTTQRMRAITNIKL